MSFSSVVAKLLLLLVIVGCGPSVEIREYVVESENERIFTSDLLKGEFSAIPFVWSVPNEWKLAANDQFSKVAWTAGKTSGSKDDQARITVSELPIAAGLVPQLGRWRGQIGIELSSTDDPMQGTESMDLGGGSGTYIDFKGKEESILGLMVPNGSNLWIFKYRSNNAVADQERERFRKFCESVKIP